jgi:hypothetical protein
MLNPECLDLGKLWVVVEATNRALAVNAMHQVSPRMRNQDDVSKRELQFRM